MVLFQEELADKVREILIEKSQLMKEYFGVYVSDDGQLTHLPLLLGKLAAKFLSQKKVKIFYFY